MQTDRGDQREKESKYQMDGGNAMMIVENTDTISSRYFNG